MIWLVAVLNPAALNMVRLAVQVPFAVYWCSGLEEEVVLLQGVPSPKLQFHEVMPTPVEASVNLTYPFVLTAETFVVKAAVGPATTLTVSVAGPEGPTGSDTVRVIVFTPVVDQVTVSFLLGEVSGMALVPKFHDQPVIDPVDVSLNITGLPVATVARFFVKLATGKS